MNKHCVGFIGAGMISQIAQQVFDSWPHSAWFSDYGTFRNFMVRFYTISIAQATVINTWHYEIYAPAKSF